MARHRRRRHTRRHHHRSKAKWAVVCGKTSRVRSRHRKKTSAKRARKPGCRVVRRRA